MKTKQNKNHIQHYLIPSYKVVPSSPPHANSPSIFKRAALDWGWTVGKYRSYGKTCPVTKNAPEKTILLGNQ